MQKLAVTAQKLNAARFQNCCKYCVIDMALAVSVAVSQFLEGFERIG
jgi:hypothetical protein